MPRKLQHDFPESPSTFWILFLLAGLLIATPAIDRRDRHYCLLPEGLPLPERFDELDQPASFVRLRVDLARDPGTEDLVLFLRELQIFGKRTIGSGYAKPEELVQNAKLSENCQPPICDSVTETLINARILRKNLESVETPRASLKVAESPVKQAFFMHSC